MGFDELAQFLENMNNLTAAHDAYIRMRNEGSTLNHIFDANKKIVRVLFSSREYGQALTTVTRLGSSITADEDIYNGGVMTAAKGTSLLGLGRLQEAAIAFSQAAPADFEKHADLMTPNDVAVYGGLLALATMRRKTLHERIYLNGSFRVYLSHEPYIRKAIAHFVHCRFGACLDLMRPYWADYKLDVHLYPHIDRIRSMIETKCIAGHCLAFSSVSFESLQKTFHLDRYELVAMLEKLIQGDGQRQPSLLPGARLDLEEGVSYIASLWIFSLILT